MKSPRQLGPRQGCEPGALSPNTAGVMLSWAGHDLGGQIIFYPMISEAQQKVEECSCRRLKGKERRNEHEPKNTGSQVRVTHFCLTHQKHQKGASFC